jgi:hypothetical protein
MRKYVHIALLVTAPLALAACQKPASEPEDTVVQDEAAPAEEAAPTEEAATPAADAKSDAPADKAAPAADKAAPPADKAADGTAVPDDKGDPGGRR